MTQTRRALIHAALEAGDDALVSRLMDPRQISRQTLNAYCAHYGV